MGELRNTRKTRKWERKLYLKRKAIKSSGPVVRHTEDKRNGFLEAVYQECLSMEFTEQGIPFVEKTRVRLDYKGRELRQTYEPDFLCFEKIIVEIKAVKRLADEHRAQVINYLKATGKQLGLLVNFGHYPKIEHERFVNQTISCI